MDSEFEREELVEQVRRLKEGEKAIQKHADSSGIGESENFEKVSDEDLVAHLKLLSDQIQEQIAAKRGFRSVAEMELADKQPLLDIGWRIDYERMGMTRGDDFVSLAELNEISDALWKPPSLKEVEAQFAPGYVPPPLSTYDPEKGQSLSKRAIDLAIEALEAHIEQQELDED